jgi:hypothetical protein
MKESHVTAKHFVEKYNWMANNIYPFLLVVGLPLQTKGTLCTYSLGLNMTGNNTLNEMSTVNC